MATEIKSGDVAVTLDGSPATLLCTLKAWRDISSHFGSFTDAWARIHAQDGPACTRVIALATGKTFAEAEEAVFATGLDDLIDPLKSYIERLSNGGKKPKPLAEKVAPTGND